MNKKELSIRQQVWLEAWIKVAGSDNCKHKTTPTAWADKCLEEFDDRFPEAKTNDLFPRSASA